MSDDKLVEAEQVDHEDEGFRGFDISDEQVAIMMELTGKTEPQEAIEHFVTVLLKNFVTPERVIYTLISDFQAFSQMTQGSKQ